jgi:LemA protein
MGARVRVLLAVLSAAAGLGLGGCGYNNLQQQDENVKAAWSEVVNQYQRRADLVRNLVNTVKGYAIQEQQVLIGVTEARARASSIQVTPEVLNNPAAFAKFQAAQGELTQALKGLMVTVEAYPQLKSDANFRDLQAQLEGTENRITVARNRYIDAVRNYNTTVRSFPTNLTANMFDFQVKPNFTVANEGAIATAPSVDFGDMRQAPPGSPPPAPSQSANPQPAAPQQAAPQPGATQPGSAQPGGAQPRSARPDSARPDGG